MRKKLIDNLQTNSLSTFYFERHVENFDFRNRDFVARFEITSCMLHYSSLYRPSILNMNRTSNRCRSKDEVDDGSVVQSCIQRS